MKIAIIGSSENNESVVDEAKELFDEVLYVPIDSIKLEVGEDQRVLYKDVDLSTFDIVLPLLNGSSNEILYLCLKILEKKVFLPILSEDFFIINKKCLLMKRLIDQGLKVRKSVFLASNRTSRMIIESLKFPIIIRSSSGKRVKVTNKETLDNVLSLFKAGNVRILEKPIEAESVIWLFVVGNEIIASYEQIGENLKSIALGGDILSKIYRVQKTINSDFFVVNFIRKKNSLIVNDVFLCPDFSVFNKITGKNTIKPLLVYLKNKLESERVGVITSIFGSIHDFFRGLVES